MSQDIDGVLLLGFGGVTDTCCGRFAECPGRVQCFVSKVLGDDPRMAARVEEVGAHYHELGGVSPYNALTFAQAEALEQELARRGRAVPVRCGFRNWPPWYEDGLQALHALGCRRIGLAVLAAHQCSRSWDDYLEQACAAAATLGDAAPEIVGHAPGWWNHPGFIEAGAAQIRAVVDTWTPERWQAAALVLTAHAIPVPAEKASPYRQQVVESAALIAEAVGHPEHVVAFQSAPDVSRIPWSAPAVGDLIDELQAAGVQDVVVQSAGFLVDHVEVVYDLDHDFQQQCQAAGLTYHRAACVHDHPAFIGALADRLSTLETCP